MGSFPETYNDPNLLLRDGPLEKVTCKVQIYFFFLSHIFFWPKTVGIHFFINNFLGKNFFAFAPPPLLLF